MIKAENPQKSLKICERSSANGGRVRLRRVGGLANFFDDRGVLAESPLAMPDYTGSTYKFD